MSAPEAAVEDAYQALVAETDRLYVTLTDRLAETNAATPIDADLAAQLIDQRQRVTELIDVLQSVVRAVIAAAVQPTS